LNPLIIFLDTKDLRKNFDYVKKNRSIEWYNFVEDYVTNQAYGREHSLEGYDGLITFYSNLKEVALDSYETLDFVNLTTQMKHLDGASFSRLRIHCISIVLA
jgi:hypothetical protein